MTNILPASTHWGWLFFLGILLMLIGLFAIASPFFTTVMSVLVFGWLLIFGGLVQLFYAFSAYRLEGFLTHLFLGLMCVLLGILLIVEPVTVAASFTLLLAFFFLVLGLIRIFGSIFKRFENWGWFLALGIIDVILGILILAHWPSSALWIIGLFVGIDFLFAGWAFATAALLARHR